MEFSFYPDFKKAKAVVEFDLKKRNHKMHVFIEPTCNWNRPMDDDEDLLGHLPKCYNPETKEVIK